MLTRPAREFGLALIAALVMSACSRGSAAPAASPVLSALVRDGDLVFHRSRSAQSRAVALATRSAYTHMGIVLVIGGKPLVLEAVQPVRLTPLDVWVRRGVDGRIVVKRLADAKQVFTTAAIERLHALGRSWLGRPYDPQFRWDDERLYCSELAFKLLERAVGVRVGRVQKARDFDLSRPEVQRKIRERFGGAAGAFDPDEPVVSPQSMFDDPKLATVFAR